MRFDKFLIGFLIFAVFILVGSLMISDMNTNYDLSMGQDSEFNKTFAHAESMINETHDLSQDMKTKSDGDITEDTTEDSMFKGGFGAIRLIWNSFGLLGNVIKDVANAIGVPSFIVSAAIAGLVIIIVFGVINYVFRFQPK